MIESEKEQLQITIETAQVDDAGAVARVEIDCWRDAYPTLLPTEFLVRSLDHRRRAASRLRRLRNAADNTLIAVTRGIRRIVGYTSFGTCRLPTLPFAGEVFELYVTADFRGVGIGRQLCQAVARRLLGTGTESLCVEVLERNGSRFFYEAIGAKLVGRRDHQFAGTVLPTLVYAWPDLQDLARPEAGASTDRPSGRRSGPPS